MRCQDCRGRGYPAFAPGGAAMPCRMCGGSGITSCCEGAVAVNQTNVGTILTTDRRLSDAEVRRLKATWEKLNIGDDTVVLRLSAERRLLARQELYHAVHTLEAQARAAKAGSTRQRALTRRAEHLRAVADQLA